MNVNSKASIAYRNIARRILGETVPLSQLEEKIRHVSQSKEVLGNGMIGLVKPIEENGLDDAINSRVCLWGLAPLLVRSATHNNPMYPNLDMKTLIFYGIGFCRDHYRDISGLSVLC